uniref:Ciliary neurotrophic factor n=1 Tax=Echeneis naucrates TaxID=173247 RepID=A0A665X0V3_ECHNA
MKELPSLSTEFFSWLNLTDWERLHAAFTDMQAFCNMLERKRKELQEDKEQIAGHTTLTQNMKHIQLDLRDLIDQVSTQMTYMKSSWSKPTSPLVLNPTNSEARSKTVWDRRVEGYIILRDLDLYLTKLARDFLLLAKKSHF